MINQEKTLKNKTILTISLLLVLITLTFSLFIEFSFGLNILSKDNSLEKNIKNLSKQELINIIKKDRTYNFEIKYEITNDKNKHFEKGHYVHKINYSIEGFPLEYNKENNKYFIGIVKESINNYIINNLITKEISHNDFKINIIKFKMLDQVELETISKIL